LLDISKFFDNLITIDCKTTLANPLYHIHDNDTAHQPVHK